MNKLKDIFFTIVTAARYSINFCLRNSKKETITRILISAANTILLFYIVQTTGDIVNVVQKSAGTFRSNAQSLKDFIESGLFGPVTTFVGLLLIGVFVRIFLWYYRNKWIQTLRYANEGELNRHRATLDVARFKSREFSDLEKRIVELPMGWQTRIWFSDEMLNLFLTLMSFGLFGASIVWHKPLYAVVLVITALPMVIAKFKIVSMWWTLFQDLVPEHKKRKVLERVFRSPKAFTQAQMFNQMPSFSREINENVNGVLDKYDRTLKFSVRKELPSQILAVIGLCIVVIHAVWSVVAYAGEIGTLTIIIAAARTFQGNLESIVSLIADQWNSAKGVILIEKDFLGLKPVIKTEDPIVPEFNTPPCITFKNVSFAYPNRPSRVLNNVNFTVQPGEKLAIVGPSGHGKSTILSLLLRHYDPTSGEIHVGEHSLRRITPSVWTRCATALTQSFVVLERRIIQEVTSSRPNKLIDLEALSAAVKCADFTQVVASDPEGLDTQIGTEFGGREFSGGEEQRLALARVLYSEGKILILDEPDAKLDPESAQSVMEYVLALKGVTVILITHHATRAHACNQVIVMRKGEVAEQGTPQELLAQGGAFAMMYKKDKVRLGITGPDEPETKTPEGEPATAHP
jgi:ABC-type multidrug transport system fused ATPase/permease subunit